MNNTEIIKIRNSTGKGIYGYTQCGNIMYYCCNYPQHWDQRKCPRCGKTMVINITDWEEKP